MEDKEGPPEATDLSPENEQLLKEAKEKYLNLLQPRLVSQVVEWMKECDIRLSEQILGKGNNGFALAATRPTRKKDEAGKWLTDDKGKRGRENIVIKWTKGVQANVLLKGTAEVKLLIREMYISTLVCHPNLPRTYYRVGPVVPDHGTTPEEQNPKCGFDTEWKPTGGFYMFQEYLEGPTLNIYVTQISNWDPDHKLNTDPENVSQAEAIREPLPVPLSQCWARQLLSAVYYLNLNGIIHRDIHRKNIMFDKHGNLKLIDFGMSYQHPDADEPEDEAERKPTVGLGVPREVAEKDRNIVMGRYSIYRKDTWQAAAMIYNMVLGWEKPNKVMKDQFKAKPDKTVAEEFMVVLLNWEIYKEAEPEQILGFLAHPWLTTEDPLQMYFNETSSAQ